MTADWVSLPPCDVAVAGPAAEMRERTAPTIAAPGVGTRPVTAALATASTAATARHAARLLLVAVLAAASGRRVVGPGVLGAPASAGSALSCHELAMAAVQVICEAQGGGAGAGGEGGSEEERGALEGKL